MPSVTTSFHFSSAQPALTWGAAIVARVATLRAMSGHLDISRATHGLAGASLCIAWERYCGVYIPLRLAKAV